MTKSLEHFLRSTDVAEPQNLIDLLGFRDQARLSIDY